MPHRFFFSYSHETYKTSPIVGGENVLDRFAKDLQNRVAALAGERAEDVGYRDLNRLRISDSWGPAIVEGLQNSAVLVCVFSPHYFASEPCGREFSCFRERLSKAAGHAGGDRQRIVPVFWEDQNSCEKKMQKHVRDFLATLQRTEEGLPEDYLRLGLSTFYADEKNTNQIVRHIAARINDLCDLPPLPRLDGIRAFDAISSFFFPRVGGGRIAEGPQGTNVVYAVGTRAMFGEAAPAKYGDKADEWRPFENTQLQIEVLTRNALDMAGQHDTKYCPIPLSGDLVAKAREAQDKNSIVLLVLDQKSLGLEPIKGPLNEYDGRDFMNVGLVSAGGGAECQRLLQEVFPVKFRGGRNNRPHHLWTVPHTSTDYERDVSNVVSALRSEVMSLSDPTVPTPSSPLPTVSQPAA